MGVPSYFRWLVARYESTILVKKLPKAKCRYLLLDFNGAIHPAVRKDIGLRREDMPAAVLKYLETIMSWVKPDKVFIAIDGVAPRAKMEQQRERRYKSVMDARFHRELNKKYGLPVSDEHVDFNMISPGTEFMDVLHDHIRRWILQQERPDMFRLSGADVPGEGEHKIMHEIRAGSADKDTTYCVYGLDADLIFLSAITNPDIFLVREATQFDSKAGTEDYRLLSIRALYDRLAYVLSGNTSLTAIAAEGIANNVAIPVDPVPMANESAARRILDYTLLCFFVGNDFLPHLPSIKIREESLSDLIVLYKVISWELKDYLISDGKINRKFLSELFASLADIEDEVLREQTTARHARISKDQHRRKRMSAYEKEKDAYENVESQWYDQIDAGQPGWKERYYKYYGCSHSVKDMIENYISGLEWVLNYYTGHSNRNWSWYYRYPVAPSVSDLVNAGQVPAHEPSPPVNPHIQLMHILPPDSAGLVPDPRLRRLMTDKSSPILWYYPSSFKIDFQGARFRHEGKCILPKGEISDVLNTDIII